MIQTLIFFNSQLGLLSPAFNLSDFLNAGGGGDGGISENSDGMFLDPDAASSDDDLGLGNLDLDSLDSLDSLLSQYGLLEGDDDIDYGGGGGLDHLDPGGEGGLLDDPNFGLGESFLDDFNIDEFLS